jgi:hypothetical protein
VITLVWLLPRVRRTNMNLQTALLRKALCAMLTLVLWVVRILVIHDKTLLAHVNLFSTARHAAAPLVLNDLVGKQGREHVGY